MTGSPFNQNSCWFSINKQVETRRAAAFSQVDELPTAACPLAAAKKVSAARVAANADVASLPLGFAQQKLLLLGLVALDLPVVFALPDILLDGGGELAVLLR